MTRVTSAMPLDFLAAVPAKMTSSILSPLSALALCAPSTQRIASQMLLLPLPFGPTIHVMPRSNSITVGSANDLNPWSSIRLKNIAFLSFKRLKRHSGGLLFRFFFALAAAAAAFRPVHYDPDVERLVVLGSFLSHCFIFDADRP